MNSSTDEKSLLYKACLALEWTLLFYLCVVPVHVYFFPELWAVQVVDQYGEEPVYTKPRFLVESKRLPQVRSVSEWSSPLDMWRFYVLTFGFVFVKFGRIGPRNVWENLKGNVCGVIDWLRDNHRF